MFNAEAYRRDFPILSRQVHGQPLVYLDNAATSQKPQAVIDAIVEYYTQHNANVHRGVHQLSDESTTAFHDSRRVIAEFFGAKPSELVIVRNTTEAANLVARSWGEQAVIADDVLLLSEMDHHSNLVPWQQLAAKTQAQIMVVPFTETGRLDMVRLQQLLTEAGSRLKLVALSHVSNALGTVNPIAEIAELLADHRRQYQVSTRFFVDGAQAAPHLPIEFAKLGVDFYAVSAHKMLGPMGIGAVLIPEALLAELPPFLYGGGMIDVVTTHTATFIDDLEERFTAGTPDVAGLVGWAAACQYLAKIGMSQVAKYDVELVELTIQKLSQLPAITILGPTKPEKSDQELGRVGSVSFVYKGVHSHDVSQILDSVGVAVRSGHHCTMPLHVKLGVAASTRASFQLYTTPAEIDVLITGLEKVKATFGV